VNLLTPLYRYALYITLAAGLVLGGYGYHAHAVSSAHASGVLAGTAAQVELEREARLLAGRADALASERASAMVASTLQSLKDTHDRTTHDLKAALARSDLRATRLDARIASLLDEAAGVRSGPPGDPSGPSGSPGAPEGDSTVEALIETTNENLAICRRNGARLAGLQAWYTDIRAGRQP
jgi:hypothetical protein